MVPRKLLRPVLASLRRAEARLGILPGMTRALLAVLLLLVAAPVALADPIPESDTSAQEFFGAPAPQTRVFGIPGAPPPRFMARNERSNLPTDAWQTDTNRLPGPLGKNMTRVSASHTAD